MPNRAVAGISRRRVAGPDETRESVAELPAASGGEEVTGPFDGVTAKSLEHGTASVAGPGVIVKRVAALAAIAPPGILG